MKRLFCLLLLACLLPVSAFAFQKGFGEYRMDHVNVRKSPGGDTLFQKQQGEEVYILEEKSQGGHLWYRVNTYDAARVNPRAGWVRADMIIPPNTLFQNIVQIAAGSEHLIALRRDGTAVYGGQQHKYPDMLQGTRPEDWQDIQQVAAGFFSVYGLRRDGSLVRWGIRGPAEGTKGVQNAQGSLVPFAAMDGQNDTFLGLMQDGSLYLFTGNQPTLLLPPGSQVRHFAAWWEIYGAGLAVIDGRIHGLTRSHEALFLTDNLQAKIASWKDVTQVVAGYRLPDRESASQEEGGAPLIAALTKEGKVYALDDTIARDTLGWIGIQKIDSGDGFLAGLTQDGRVLCAGENKHKIAADTAPWQNIVDIACGDDFCAGVTQDGRLLFAGDASFSHH